MIYDKTRKQFYITKADVTNNSIITEEDMRAEFGSNFEQGLKSVSQKVYRFIDKGYIGVYTREHALMIRKLIFDDKEKQLALLDAMVYYVEKAIDLGFDVADDMPIEVAEQLEMILEQQDVIQNGEFILDKEEQLELEGDWV